MMPLEHAQHSLVLFSTLWALSECASKGLGECRVPNMLPVLAGALPRDARRHSVMLDAQE
jgi:hypothetical protein